MVLYRPFDQPGGHQAGPSTIKMLGPLDVRRGGRPLVLPPRRRSLLALLAFSPGRVVTAEQLVDGLWGEDAPPTALRTLHAHIAKLGADLSRHRGERPIRRQAPGYLLRADAVDVDGERFEESVTTGLRFSAQGRFAEASRSLRAGLALWRGNVVSDCQVHGWALAEIGYLDGLRLQAYEGEFAASLAAGVTDTAVGRLERLVGEHPLRERLWELLIVALRTAGRPGDALGAYHRARRTLIDELGIEPGEGLRHVEAGVLRGVTDPRMLLRLSSGPPVAITDCA
ncbi:AfsR/SARP family transcriptional regulator [Nonomuraea sp. NPDC003707]